MGGTVGVAVAEAGADGTGQQQFQIVGGGDPICVFLGNRFALFGKAQVAADTAVRQGPDEPVRRTGTPADRTAPAVEEPNADTMLDADPGHGGLCPVQAPQTGGYAAVLVAVAVADHHLLDRLVRPIGRLPPRQAGPGYRMRQEMIQDVGCSLEIVDGLEQRDHRQQADRLPVLKPQQAGLARQHVHHQQVREPTCHADDQGAQATTAIAGDLGRQDPVRLQDRGGIAARLGVGMEKGTRRRQFPVQQVQALRLGPVREPAIADAGGGQQLCHRLVVETAVLPDIEHGQVEAESVRQRPHRTDVTVRDTDRADVDQRRPQKIDIGDQFTGVTVGAVTRHRAVAVGQGRHHEIDELAPGLTGIAIDSRSTGLPQCGGQGGYSVQQRPGRRLPELRQAEHRGHLDKAVPQQAQRFRPEDRQGMTGHIGINERMTVPVATDPGAEGQPRPSLRFIQESGVEARRFPRGQQPPVDPWQNVGQHLAEIVHDVGQFRRHRGLLQIDLTGAPKVLEGGFDLPPQPAPFGRCPHLVFPLHQQPVERSVMG